MLLYDSCQAAVEACFETKTFSIARLYSGEKTMDIHIHNCCEIYYSISGGRQFLIDNRVYTVRPGDIFFINPFESHHLTRVDRPSHERVVLPVWPEYLRRLSTEQTPLDRCFFCRDAGFGHRLSLTEEERRRFLYYIHKLTLPRDYAQDLLDQATFTELMVFLNQLFLARLSEEAQGSGEDGAAAGPGEMPQRPGEGNRGRRHAQIDGILSYINQHLAEDLSIPLLSSRFYLSGSYLCRIFKEATGTTINRYVTAKRIARAKALLAEGHSASETAALCGFGDYSNFLKAFTRVVGVSPKKFVSYLQD